ncbi:hypothetical protein LINPERPRIM_LOCUS30146 [Linum perenne]
MNFPDPVHASLPPHKLRMPSLLTDPMRRRVSPDPGVATSPPFRRRRVSPQTQPLRLEETVKNVRRRSDEMILTCKH